MQGPGPLQQPPHAQPGGRGQGVQGHISSQRMRSQLGGGSGGRGQPNPASTNLQPPQGPPRGRGRGLGSLAPLLHAQPVGRGQGMGGPAPQQPLHAQQMGRGQGWQRPALQTRPGNQLGARGGRRSQRAMLPQQGQAQAYQGSNAPYIPQHPYSSMNSPTQRSSPSQQSASSHQFSSYQTGGMGGDEQNYPDDAAQ